MPRVFGKQIPLFSELSNLDWKIMKLYTRSGDNGSTGLFGGGRVSKDHPRVTAYGTVDETNAIIGLAMSAIPSDDDGFLGRMHSILHLCQSRLFDIGADLATPEGTAHEEKTVRLPDAAVAEMEHFIDEVESGNAPMTTFVLPGGSELAARLHMARTVARRAERKVVELAHTETVSPNVVAWINRLSDLLFAMARRANRELQIEDIPWLPKKD